MRDTIPLAKRKEQERMKADIDAFIQNGGQIRKFDLIVRDDKSVAYDEFSIKRRRKG